MVLPHFDVLAIPPSRSSTILSKIRINKALGTANSLVGYFHEHIHEHSSTQVEPGCSWNSSYYMIKRLLERRWPVTATLSDPEVTNAAKHYLDIKADQWSLLGGLQKALEPFKQATVFLSGETYLTGSVLPPLVKGLHKSKQTAFESAPITTFQAAATAEIESLIVN